MVSVSVSVMMKGSSIVKLCAQTTGAANKKQVNKMSGMNRVEGRMLLHSLPPMSLNNDRLNKESPDQRFPASTRALRDLARERQRAR